MSTDNQEVLKTVMQIAGMPLSLEEKKSLLIATRDCYATGEDETKIFNKYIESYTELIGEAKRRAEEMQREIYGRPHVVPC